MFKYDSKNDSIREFMNGTQADIVGMVERGICWHRPPMKDRLWERTRGWFESLKVTAAYNRHNKQPPILQWGGTSLWSLNNAAHHAIDSGVDPSGLDEVSRQEQYYTPYHQCILPMRKQWPLHGVFTASKLL
jgi:hypothetical protein